MMHMTLVPVLWRQRQVDLSIQDHLGLYRVSGQLYVDRLLSKNKIYPCLSVLRLVLELGSKDDLEILICLPVLPKC